MSRPNGQRYGFHFADLDALRHEVQRRGLDIPLAGCLTPLGSPVELHGTGGVPNRFCLQPMEGLDAQTDGSPGDLTLRRYTRYARGGFGLIWVEATAFAPEIRSNPRQLHIHEGNIAAFARLVEAIRQAAGDAHGRPPVIVLQLAHAGRYCAPDGAPRPYLACRHPQRDARHEIPTDHPLVPDTYLDTLPAAWTAAARLAIRAGFDGVDIKCCHGDLLSDLLAATTRVGRYGGTFDSRSRLLRTTVSAVRAALPDALLAVRLGVPPESAPAPAAATASHNQTDETARLAAALAAHGIDLLNVVIEDADDRDPVAAFPPHDDNPLEAQARRTHVLRAIRAAAPALPLVAGGFAGLRHFAPHAGAALLATGDAALVGLGRLALAYPDAPADVLATGQMDPRRCCILCEACVQLMRDGGITGCVIHDRETYGPEYRHRRRFALDHLREQAARCRNCAPAPCATACPTAIDVPAFVRAFHDGDIARAYAVIRRANALPEMCSHLCPGWLVCEGACVETTLAGNPVPIRDLQYAVCWMAREQGLTGIRLPARTSGHGVAIVGGGPAGLAAAVTLLEAGHRVVLYEREDRLGGTPDGVIRPDRYPGDAEEIEAMLRPAVENGTLDVRLGQALGRDVSLKELRQQYDAVLLAAGLWQEASLGRVDGVLDALTFLKRVKRGELTAIPERVAVLSGGDSAMDAAATALRLGATDVFVVYAGSYADMHWHADDAWFRTPGTHCLTLTQPLGYDVGGDGALRGVRVRGTDYGPPDADGRRRPVAGRGGDYVLDVGLAIEAMGLGVEDELRKALPGIAYNDDGLLATARANTFATGLEGVYAAGALLNGGATVAQCVAEGMAAAREIDAKLQGNRGDR